MVNQHLLVRVGIVGLKKELLELAMAINDESEKIFTREVIFNEVLEKVKSCTELEELCYEDWGREVV